MQGGLQVRDTMAAMHPVSVAAPYSALTRLSAHPKALYCLPCVVTGTVLRAVCPAGAKVDTLWRRRRDAELAAALPLRVAKSEPAEQQQQQQQQQRTCDDALVEPWWHTRCRSSGLRPMDV